MHVVTVLQTNEAKIVRIKGEDKQFNSNSWRLQHSTLIMDKTIRQKLNKEIANLDNSIN